MRTAKVLFKNEEAGTLFQHNDGSFTFSYSDSWLTDIAKPGIALTIPKSQKEYQSPYLFPFFYNMLPEGANKQALCSLLRIDPNDNFGLLMAAAGTDAIGAIRVVKLLTV